MGAKKFDKNSTEWHMFADYWTLCQKFWITEDTDKYWHDVVENAKNFSHKYNQDEFAVQLAVAFITGLENKDKKQKENARNEPTKQTP